MSCILFLEADLMVRKEITPFLLSAGLHVNLAGSIFEAKSLLKKRVFGAILMGIHFQDGNGIEFCRELRAQFVRIPILVLASQTGADTAVNALKAGANDFLCQPYPPKELVQKLRNYLELEEKNLTFEELILEASKGVVIYRERKVKFGKKECEIFALLLRFRNQFVSREAMVRVIDPEGELFDRTVDSHISHIRRKLRQIGVKEIEISNRYGMGYKLKKRCYTPA